MKMIYHQWFVCLLILLFVGCDSEKKSVKDDPSNQRATFVNKTTKKERDAASARRASSLRASKVKEDPGKMLSLKSLDKWKDLPEEVRSRLYQRKTKGKTEISEKEFEELRAKYDLQFAIEKRQKESWQPVLSKSEPHQGRYEYATEPVAADAEAFHLVGVDAFMKRDIKGVSSEEKKTVEKMIRDVYSSRTRKVGPKFWEEISGKFVRLMYKVPAFRTEPMVQYCAGWANQEVKRFDYSDGYFNTAALNLPGTDYPARFAVNVHAARVKSQQFRLADKEPGIRLAEYYLAVVYWLENDFRASAQDHRLAYEMVNRFITTCESNGKWDLLTQFMKDISKQNHLPVWLKAMCRGRISSELAWRWRGNGYASTVSEDSWKPFEQYQKIAAEEFEKAHKANPLFPESAANLIGISMTGHNDKPEQYWFDKAIEGQVDYMSAYRSRLLSMLPQWGGSVQEMYDFAKLHADKEQYDTNVPMVLVQFHYTTIRYVAGDEKDEILKKPAVVKATIKAIEGVMGSRSSRPNGAGLLDDNYYLTLKAIFATEGKMFDVARESFELIGDDFHQSALEDLRMYAIELVRGKAYLMSGEHADECKELYDLLAAAGPDAEKTDDQKSEIVDRCTALMEKIDEPHALNWLQTVRDKFQFENEFALGMDASLAFDEGLSFWVLGDRSQFKSESRNSVLIDSTDSTKRMTMTSLLNAAGDSKVIEFDIALEKEPKKRGFAAQGLSRHFTPSVSVMNYRGAPFAFGLNRLYRIHKTKPENVFELGQFSFGWKDGQNGLYYYKTAINLDTNRIRLKIAPGYFEAYMNDRFICR